jgi:hypothetical protein
MSQQKFLLKRLANISFLSKIRIFCYKMQFSLHFSTRTRIVQIFTNGIRTFVKIRKIRVSFGINLFGLRRVFIKKVIFFKKKSFFGNFFEGLNVLYLSVLKQIRLFILFYNLINIVCHACLDFI